MTYPPNPSPPRPPFEAGSTVRQCILTGQQGTCVCSGHQAIVVILVKKPGSSPVDKEISYLDSIILSICERIECKPSPDMTGEGRQCFQGQQSNDFGIIIPG